MISRRGVLHVASLGVLAAPALAACGQPANRRASTSATELVSSDVRRVAPDPAALPAAIASLHAFGARLWPLVATGKDSAAISPYSIAVAIGMTLNGANGATRREMLDVLGAGSEQALNRGLNTLTRHVESLADPKVSLAAANQLFGQRGVSWEGAFLDALARQYGAGLRVVDFAAATEAARRIVNEWTAARTHDRIGEILPSGSVDPSTRLVLVNALYFKAPWLEPFETSLTAEGDFRLANADTVRVPMMHGSPAGASTATGDGWTAVRLPYIGGRLAMTIVLPDEGRDVDVTQLPAVLAAPLAAGVDLTLPRWAFRTEMTLGGTLAELGMPSAFDEVRADFTRMTDSDEHLVIDEVYHQVFVAVDEAGTEAAAATAVSVRTVSAPAPGLAVVVDRPFVFVIHDAEHGTPLFLGRVADPRP